MSRLTNDTRNAIARNAIAFAFDPKREALEKEESELAHEVHAHLFKKSDRDLVEKLDPKWIVRITVLKINANGQSIELTSGSALPVPYYGSQGNVGNYYYTTGAIPSGDLCDRIQAHAMALEKYKEDRQGAYRKVEAMLTGVTTVKKLREAWPEGEQFYSPFEDKPAPQVPALRVEEINAMLGLPVEFA